MMIIAPRERYMPPASLSCSLIERTSIRRFLFSNAFNFDLSIAFISSNRINKALAFADAAGFGRTKEEGAVSTVALAIDWIGWTVNDKHVAIIQRVVFFILIDLNYGFTLNNSKYYCDYGNNQEYVNNSSGIIA